MKLIQTQDYLLLTEKVYGFKAGYWNYEEDNTIPIYQFSYDIDKYPGNKIIAYYPLTKEAKELDLPLLPNPFEENIEILWLDFNKNHNKNCPLGKEQFVRAINYKAAQSKTSFTLEDMEKAFEYGKSLEPFDCFEDFIQSLSTQQFPSEFIPEMTLMKEYIDEQDAYGYDIWKLKTITNSKGKEVLVGTYKN